MTEPKEYILVEKYRPTKLKDVVLEDDVRKQMEKFLEDGDFPHLLFYGSPGVGKTTVAKALCMELKKEFLFVNASLDSNVDTLKEKIQNFARTMTIGSGKKVVILDEIDGVRSVGFFDGLRPVIERFSKNCVFILTCNFIEKVPDAIKSRPIHFDFSIKDKKEYAKKVFRVLTSILRKENIEYDNVILKSIIKHHFPDVRSMINSVQKHRGELNDERVLYRLDGSDIKPLIDALKSGDTKKMREYITENVSFSSNVYSQLYNRLSGFMDNSSIPQAILILDDYQSREPFCVDKQLHLMAMCVEIGGQCKFK